MKRLGLACALLFVSSLTWAQTDTLPNVKGKYAFVDMAPAYMQGNLGYKARLCAFYEDGRVEVLQKLLPFKYKGLGEAGPFETNGQDKTESGFHLSYRTQNLVLMLAYMRKQGYELVSKETGTCIFRQVKPE